MQRNELTTYLTNLLEVNRFKDYGPNGLQVEGRSDIYNIVTGVTACQALIDQAIDEGADAILVHHGLFWHSDSAVVTGMKQRRLKALLAHDINLFAYHLPLDAHSSLGNNAQLALKLGLRSAGALGSQEPLSYIFHGEVEGEAISPRQLAERIATALGRQPLHIEGLSAQIKRVAWATGAAQSLIHQVLDKGIDAYISGEISEPTTHIAREMGLHYYAAGHHATERYGIQALGEHLTREFGLAHRFIEVGNPA